jgi:hypothetical protein
MKLLLLLKLLLPQQQQQFQHGAPAALSVTSSTANNRGLLRLLVVLLGRKGLLWGPACLARGGNVHFVPPRLIIDVTRTKAQHHCPCDTTAIPASHRVTNRACCPYKSSPVPIT